VKDNPLVPSMRRGEGNPLFPTAGCNPWLTINWQSYAQKMVHNLNAEVEQTQIDAVMQHYGYRSFFVDVTSDPEVALWFALHEFRPKKSPFYIDDELKSAIFQWSRFDFSDTGFVYVIAISKELTDRYVNLMEVLPTAAARIHRQKAGALYCFYKSKSIDEFVVAKLRISDGGWFRNSASNVATTGLFPLPSVDLFYRQLCTVPYFISPEKEMENIKIGHPLLGYFPIYAESAKELVKEYLPLTRIIDQTHPALKWNVATTTIEFENRRFRVAGATRISLYRLMLDKISETAPLCQEFQEGAFPSNNLLFEFEPDVSLFNLSEKALESIIRGLWVVFGSNSIRISEIVDDFNDVHLDHECIYSKPKLELIGKTCNCQTHDDELKLVLEIARSLTDGTLFLNQGDNGYLKLDYKESKD